MLVLSVEPRQAHHAEAELLRRFGTDTGMPLQRLSFDSLLLAQLHLEARAAKISDWNIVLRADAAEQGSRDWIYLQRLVKRALVTIKPMLLGSARPMLLTNVGLLARYDLMTLVTDLETATGRPGHTPSLWMLLSSHKRGLPVIDGVSVPLVSSARAFNLPLAWVKNQHRATAMS